MLPVALEKFGFNQVDITGLLGQAQFCGADTDNVTVLMAVLGPLKIMTITMTETVGEVNQDGLTFANALPQQYWPQQNFSTPITLIDDTASTYSQVYLNIQNTGAIELLVADNLNNNEYIISQTFLYL
jgi:hypothetical protein